MDRPGEQENKKRTRSEFMIIDKSKYIAILKRYAKETGTIVRSTSDLSPLELWLINKITAKQLKL